MLFGFLVLAFGCSYEDATTIKTVSNAPPVNHNNAKAFSLPNARDNCSYVNSAFRNPNAYNTLLGYYDAYQAGSPVDLRWYITTNPGHFGYFPVAANPTLTITLRGPTPNYPIVNSAIVTNNSNASETISGTTVSLGAYSLGVPYGSPCGWYYYMIEYDAPNGTCAYSAVDIQVVKSFRTLLIRLRA